MAVGERSPLAVLDAVASGRMALAESLTNLVSANIGPLSQVKLSANWMAASGFAEEDEKLFETVRAVGMDMAPALGLCIPVGKDSMSMKTVWEEGEQEASVVSPVSLIISAFAPVKDVRETLTPELKSVGSTLLLLELQESARRLGGSIAQQVSGALGGIVSRCRRLSRVGGGSGLGSRIKRFVHPFALFMIVQTGGSLRPSVK